MFKKIISFLLVIAIFFSFSSPVFAADVTGHSHNLWDALIHLFTLQSLSLEDSKFKLISFLGQGEMYFYGLLSDSVCTVSDDGYHHAYSVDSLSSTGSDLKGDYFYLICDDCGDPFKVYSSDLKEAYSHSVGKFPSSTITSDGSFLWSPAHTYLEAEVKDEFGYFSSFYCSHYSSSSFSDSGSLTRGTYYIIHSSDLIKITAYPANGRSAVSISNPKFYFSGRAPVSGTYYFLAGDYILTSNNLSDVKFKHYSASTAHYSAGSTISITINLGSSSYYVAQGSSYLVSCNYPQYKVVPDVVLDITSGDTYNIDNRVSNYITNYTYDNQTYNQQIINETNNTYYSPITNETYDMSGWTYDYSTRTYNVTYNEGDTVNITYGDENITIVEGGNTYNYYYYITNEGGGEEGDDGGILAWLRDFKDWLGGKFNDLIGAVGDVSVDVDSSQHTDYDVTIYDEDGEEQQFSISDVKAKFAWLSDVKEIGNTFLTEVQANEQAAYSYNANGPPLLGASGNPTGAPSIPINLGAAQSHYGYVYGGEVEALDLSWYAPYKSTVDHLISGFLWLLFLWGLWKNAPNIISGSGILSNRVEDIKSGEKGKKK